MYRKMFFALVVAAFTGSVALTQTLPPQNPGGNAPLVRGKISKVEPNKVYFQTWDPVTKKYGAVQEYPVTNPDLLKIYQMNGTKQQAINGGLKADVFTNPQGVYGTLQMQGGQLRGITLMDQAAMQGLPNQPLPPGGAGGAGGTGGAGGKGG